MVAPIIIIICISTMKLSNSEPLCRPYTTDGIQSEGLGGFRGASCDGVGSRGPGCERVSSLVCGRIRGNH